MNYRGAKLDATDFSGRNLTTADFRGASLRGANFRHANLSNATLRGADVYEADFTDAGLTDTDMSNLRNPETAKWAVDFDWRARIVPPIATPQTEEERLHAFYFDRENRLTQIPVGQKRQRFVLDRIIKSFDFAVRYPESIVNERLRTYNDDFCTLRRYLIDHRLMRRENNIYWRTASNEEMGGEGLEPATLSV